MASLKSTPKDAQVMSSILKEIGIQDYEPRILNQMLEFCYRYVTNVVDDAQAFSSYAKKNCIDIEDVKLALHLQSDKYFTSPPPRELLVMIARQKNNTPLPLIKSTAGPRLPPDRYSLTSCNYRLKCNSKKQRVMPPTSRLNLSSLQSTTQSATKFSPVVNIPKPVTAPAVTMLSRTVPSITAPKVPTPIIKFSDGNRTTPPVPATVSAASSMPSQIIMPSIVMKPDTQSLREHGEKRKLPDDAEDYDAE